MDPVDKVFDTAYYYSQKASNLVTSGANRVTNLANNAVGAVLSKVHIQKDTPSEVASPTGILGSNYGVGIKALAQDNQKLLTITFGVTGLAIAGYLVTNQQLFNDSLKQKKKKRRAVRLDNGARKDVVLIVGSVVEPLTRYIANDLENRGFIVYVTSTNSKADAKFFDNESISDIKSLIISENFQDNDFNAEQIRKFDFLLSSEHIPFQGATSNKLNLVGMVFVPDLYYPKGKFHLIPPSSMIKNISKNSLIPLNLLSNGLVGLAEKYDSNLIFLSPIISSSLRIPYHSTENITNTFLQELVANIAVDYESLNVTNLKLGSLSVNSNNNRKNYGIKGEPLRKLHYKLFDLIYSDDNRTIVYVGFGARTLDYFGRFIPKWLIANYFQNYFGNE